MKSRELLLVASTTLLGCLTVLFLTLWLKHECPITERIVIKEKYIEQLKEITHADTKDDIDSLLFEHFGFQSK